MSDFFSALADFLTPPAIVRQVDETKPTPAAEPAQIDPTARLACGYALGAFHSMLRAGFSEHQAFAAALDVFAAERPRITGENGTRARRLSQKRSRAIRALASSILIEEQAR